MAGPNTGDDDAIATDKEALLPGGAATFANYTSYYLGMNGIMVDLASLPNGGAGIDASDFIFGYGNDNSPSGRTTANPPKSVRVRALPGASHRITTTWDDLGTGSPDMAIPTSNWLRVEVLANADTGLAANDVFYSGHAVGETGGSASNAYVNMADELGARYNPHSFFDPAPIADQYDLNRDARVNVAGDLMARYNPTSYFTALKSITGPAAPTVPAGAPADTCLDFLTPAGIDPCVGVDDPPPEGE